MSEYVFKLPDLGEGTVESEIAEWMVGVGDTVQEEDAVCSMLTDKAAVELSAPVSGKVVKLAGDVGDIVPVGSPLIVFETEAAGERSADASAGGSGRDATTSGDPASTGSSASADSPASPTKESEELPEHKVRTSPSIRRRARESGVDLHQVPGSGPRGRILKADFEAYLAAGGDAKGAQRSATERTRAAGSTEIKLVGLRRKIAEHMDRANRDIPHFAYVEEVDVTALESLRQHLNSRRDDNAPRYTLLPFIGLALSRVLNDFPQCNAHYDAERQVLVRHNAVHLGIATQTDDGLKVPVVRHAEARSLSDMASEIRRVTGAARDNSAKREELSGSTITLTSLGKLGGIVSTPIINFPEVAIIGVNKASERPIVLKGQVVVRTIMNLSSSFDHRFVDGFDAAAMIQELRLLLEQPAAIFIR